MTKQENQRTEPFITEGLQGGFGQQENKGKYRIEKK